MSVTPEQSAPRIARYASDSTEAMLRVITMFMVADGEVRAGEVQVLDRLGILQELGTERERLSAVARQYFADLDRQAAAQGRVDLNDDAWVDAVLEPIQGTRARLFLARLLLVIARADGRFADAELGLLRRILERWNLSLEDLANA
jgi:uncharacterized tellurite resistance protein B-like protein